MLCNALEHLNRSFLHKYHIYYQYINSNRSALLGPFFNNDVMQELKSDMFSRQFIMFIMIISLFDKTDSPAKQNITKHIL